MLAKQNRINHINDFRLVMRKGKKSVSTNFIVSVLKSDAETRFGFVVAKNISKRAVHRNLVRRRLQVLAQDFTAVNPTGFSVVVRALPGAESLTWDEQKAQIEKAFAKIA